MPEPADNPKLRALIERFPWGPPGFLDSPRDATFESRLALVKGWLAYRLTTFKFWDTALALHACIQRVLDEVEEALPATEKPRHFYSSDLKHILKPVDSILDRMIRTWDPSSSRAPEFGFDDFHTSMKDLARFRIVLNFLSDVELVCGKIEEPYCCGGEDVIRLSPAQQSLYNGFALDKHTFENLIEVSPEHRKTGERCRKAIFYPRNNPGTKVEVQIQTMLQEAWDKKDHFLIYEPKRRGETIEAIHRIDIYAMSELLYLADRTFDRLLETVRRGRAANA